LAREYRRIAIDIGGGRDALESLGKARDLYAELLRTEPHNPEYQNELSQTERAISRHLFHASRYAEAREAAQRAIDLLTRPAPSVRRPPGLDRLVSRRVMGRSPFALAQFRGPRFTATVISPAVEPRPRPGIPGPASRRHHDYAELSVQSTRGGTGVRVGANPAKMIQQVKDVLDRFDKQPEPVVEETP
jgi:hypothetical protein